MLGDHDDLNPITDMVMVIDIHVFQALKTTTNAQLHTAVSDSEYKFISLHTLRPRFVNKKQCIYVQTYIIKACYHDTIIIDSRLVIR